MTGDVELRAIRAERLVQVGELRQALEGVALAPGNEATPRQLIDASREATVTS